MSTDQTRPAEIDSCGSPRCDRALGRLVCERCGENLDALARALEREGIELTAQEAQEPASAVKHFTVTG